MKKKNFLLCFIVLILVLTVALGMVACSSKEVDNGTQDEEEEAEEQAKKEFSTVGAYMDKVNSGLAESDALLYDEQNPLSDYAVTSQYEITTGVANYTIEYSAVYTDIATKNRYYLRLFDNALHINRLTVYYDGKDLYAMTEKGNTVAYDFNVSLFFTVFNEFVRKIDAGSFLYGDFVREYVSENSLLTGCFDLKNCFYNQVDKSREAITFKQGDVTVLTAIANSYREAFTEGIGDSFDAVSTNILGFKLSRLIEYSFNTILLNQLQFYLTDGKVGGASFDIGGKMLDNSSYSLLLSYQYDTVTDTITQGEKLKTDYSFTEVSPEQGSFTGTVTFPTIREDPYEVALDYDLDSKNNENNQFTLRIFDQNSTETEITDRYANISSFLCLYYTNELLFIDAEGLCDYIGTPVELESLHLPKVYMTGVDVSSLLQMAFNYIIHIGNVFIDMDYRNATTGNKQLYNAILEAMSTSEDLSTISLTVTEQLLKDIRQDDTSASVLLSRMMGMPDNTLNKYLGSDFFQLVTVIASYNFETGKIIFDDYYNRTLYATFELYADDYEGITMAKDLNEVNYAILKEPTEVTLEYDAYLTPYEVQSVDVGAFFGIFIGDSSGKNTSYRLTYEYRLAIKGKVSEYYVNVDGENVLTTTVDIGFYERSVKTGEETPLLSVVTNPYDTNELLVSYYMPIGSFDNQDGVFFRIQKEVVSEQLRSLTGEDNIFLTQNNLGILLGLISSVGGNGKVYTSDGYYNFSMVTTEKDDPVYEITGIANTYALAKIRMSFTKLDLSNIKPSNYSTPNVAPIDNVSAQSIYATDSNWVKNATVYVSGHAIEMELSYVPSTVAIETDCTSYKPTAYLFGVEISYKFTIVEKKGTYVIQDLLMTDEWTNPTKAYTLIKTNAREETGNGTTLLPQYLLLIDPAYTKVLPTSVEVRYNNQLSGKNDCVVTGFLQSNITIEGYNLACIAGEYSSAMPSYTLRIGINSLETCSFQIYVAVLNRSVVSYKKDAVSLTDEKAMINNEQSYERLVGLETQTGETYNTVIGKETVPVVGVLSVDPYTYAMRTYGTNYEYLKEEIQSNELSLVFKGYYGVTQTKDESGVSVQLNKYYNKEGYNYFSLASAVTDWSLDTSKITWQGGICYALGYYGDEQNGYAIRVAIRLNVMKKDVTEVQIDNETNSVYTIDYLIKSTYEIPTTGQNNHTVRVVFSDGTSRFLIPTRLTSLSDDEYYTEYVLGSLVWNGTAGLEKKLSVQGTTSLFGSGRDATSVTTAEFGTGLGVGIQVVSLSVLQPSRYQSSDDETDKYIVKKYTVDQNGKYVPEMGLVSISYAKFSQTADAMTAYSINPYDYTASLPSTIWLYVYRDTVTRTWKEYDVQWTTTDKEGNELNLIKESNGRYVLAHPSTEERDLVVYGTVGDGKSVIWVTMVVKNLQSELQKITFYNYSYEPQTSLTGQIPTISVYYEYFEDGKAPTMDTTFMPKSYFTKVEETVQGQKRISYIPYTTFTLGATIPTDVKLYEQITNGYGRTEDVEFDSQKVYYIQQTNEFDETKTIAVDPYDDYTAKMPTHFTAVLGSGAVVTDEDIVMTEEGETLVGLTWYVVFEGDTTEYPLVREGFFFSSGYDKYYDEDGQFIFPYTQSACGLKCYIKGNTGIANEAQLRITIDARVIYTAKVDTKNTTVADIYNGQTDDVNESKGIYAGEGAKGYVDINRYEEDSLKICKRLESILENDGFSYIGTAFDGVEKLYSLPVYFDTDALEKIIKVLNGTTQMTEADTEKELYLTGKVCKGTINEQKVSILFVIRNDMLASITIGTIPKSVEEGVLSISNDVSNDGVLTISELEKVMHNDYFYGTEYNRYLGKTGVDSYQGSDYDYVLVFDIDKAYGLSIDKNGYFCTPYEYFVSMFSSLTLTFADGHIDNSAVAEISLLNSTVTTDSGIDYLNYSVLGLVDETVSTVTDGSVNRAYSYSFFSLSRIAQGSAQDKVLVVVKAEKATAQNYEEAIIMEPFNNELTTAYDENGYALPSSITVQYATNGGETYDVIYKTSSWKVESSTLGETELSAIPQERIDVINGATYRFHYVLPCSGMWCNLSVTVPKKDIKNVGYNSSDTDEGKLTVKNGILEITNPFQVIHYDSENNRYLLDESVIPTYITPIGTDDYQTTSVNIFEVEWNYHYQRDDKSYYLTSSVFTLGTSDLTVFPNGMFLFATYRYAAYYTFNETEKVSTKKEFEVYLYVKIAALTFKAVEVDDEDVSVTSTDDGEGNTIYNRIQIDPYEASYDGKYPLPSAITVSFGSLLPGASKGTVIRYRFEKIGSGAEFGVTYWLKNSSALNGIGANVSNILYNEQGHLMSSTYSYLEDRNNVPILMGIILGTESNYFTVPINVYILARIIDKVNIPNIVYDDGEYLYVNEDTYSFEAVDLSVGREISGGNYYEYSDKRYVLTSDAYVLANKKYYVRADGTENGDVGYVYKTYYEETASNGTATKQKATVAVGEYIGIDYYRTYSAYEKVTSFEAGTYYPQNGDEFTYTESQILWMSDSDKAIPNDGSVCYFDEEEQLYFAASGKYKANVTYVKLGAAQKYDSSPAGDVVLFKRSSFIKVVSPTRTVFEEVTISSFAAGQTYYTMEDGMYDSTGTNCYYACLSEGRYVALDKSVLNTSATYFVFKEAKTYKNGTTYYQALTERKTFGSLTYYRREDKDNPTSLTSDLYTFDSKTQRYVHPDSIVSGTKYYTFETVKVGDKEYYLDEEYYEIIGERYCLTSDTVFSRTKNYYIFRTKENGEYYLFEGYEASVYYAYADVNVDLKEKYEKDSDASCNEVPIYYIDPYNSSSFRLPTEAAIKFGTSTEYKTYSVKGWEWLDTDAEKPAFTALTHYTTDESMVEECLRKGIEVQLYTDTVSGRFYDIVSGSGSKYYGFYNPTDIDYGGNTYLLRGYIAVGDSYQYFYISVVVLNRSLKTTGEIGDFYSVEYDYDDPIGALLSDIPTEMGEDMFVSYDSYYLHFDIDNIAFTLGKEDLFGFNNGNVPLVPTIRWQDTWEYNGKEYTFNELIDTGYDGDIYGNVYADDTYLNALYNAYKQTLSEKYVVLLYAWMWDKYSTTSYHLEATEKILELNETLENMVRSTAMELLLQEYSDSNEIADQQKSEFIAQTLLAEVNEEYKTKYGKENDGSEEATLELVEMMYSSLEKSYTTWAVNAREDEKNTRVLIYMEWSEKITEFKVNNSLSSGLDDFKPYCTDYQKLKAEMYLAMQEEDLFSETEKKSNLTQYNVLAKSIENCYNRDMWDYLYENISLVEKSAMADVYAECSSVSDLSTVVKSYALQKYMAQEKEGVVGEDTVADVTIPVLTLEKLGGDSETTEIKFSPYNFKSIEESFTVTFELSYGKIYQEKVANAVRENNEQYEETYAEAELIELANKLKQDAIDGFVPKTKVAGDEYTIDIQLKNGEDFTYQNYKEYIAELGVYGYQADVDLWTKLYNYFVEEAQMPIVYYKTQGQSNSDYIQAWSDLKAFYTTQKTQADEEEGEYIDAMLTRMNGYNAITGENCITAFTNLLEDVKDYYPVLKTMNECFEQGKEKVASEPLTSSGTPTLLADKLVTVVTTTSSPYYELAKNIENDDASDKDWYGFDKIFAFMYSDIGGLNVARAITTAFAEEGNNISDGRVTDSAEQTAFCLVNYNRNSINKSSTTALSYLEVQTGAKYVMEYLLWFVANDGATPYDYLCEPITVPTESKWYEEKSSLLEQEEETAESFIFGDTVCNRTYLEQLVNWVMSQETSDYNKYRGYLEQLFDSEDFAGKFGQKDEFMREFARYIVYKLVLNELDTEEKNRLENLRVYATGDVYKEAVLDLFNNELVSQKAEEVFFRQEGELGLLIDPMSKWDTSTKSNAHLYSISSAALQYFMDSVVEESKEYWEKLQAEIDEVQEEKETVIAKAVLDELNQNTDAEYAAFKKFLQNDKGRKAYELTEEGGKVIGNFTLQTAFSLYFTDYQTELEKQEPALCKNFPKTLEALCDSDEEDQWNSYIATRLEVYSTDFLLGSIVDMYESLSEQDLRRNIIEEVVLNYLAKYSRDTVAKENGYFLTGGEFTFDEKCFIAAEVIGEGTVGTEIYNTLLLRYDIGLDVEEQLTNRYYTFYLKKGMEMLAYETQNATVDVSEELINYYSEIGVLSEFLDKRYSDLTTIYATIGTWKDAYLTSLAKVLVTVTESNYAEVADALEELDGTIYRKWLSKEITKDAVEKAVDEYKTYTLARIKGMFSDITTDDVLTAAEAAFLSGQESISETAISVVKDRNVASIYKTYEKVVQAKSQAEVRSQVTSLYASMCDAGYGEELENIFGYIVEPGLTKVYKNAKDDLGYATVTTSIADHFYYFDSVSKPTFNGTNVYYEKDENGWYYETEDTEAQIGITYYTKKEQTDLSVTAKCYTDYYYVIDSLTEQKETVYVYKYADEQRYNRVSDILTALGTDYPNRDTYYADIFARLETDSVDEKTAVFNEAVSIGIQYAVLEEMFDTLSFLTMEKEDFLSFSSSLTEDDWYQYFKKDTLAGKALQAIENQYDSDWDNIRDAIATFLGRVGEYRDEEFDRGVLTTENIIDAVYCTYRKDADNKTVTVDSSAVTRSYKVAFMNLLLYGETFMTDKANSMSLLCVTLQNLYAEICDTKAIDFNKISTHYDSDALATKTTAELLYEELCTKEYSVSNNEDEKEEQQKIATDYDRYYATILEVLSHTSVYVKMNLSQKNALKDYLNGVYKEVLGVDLDGNVISSVISENQLGQKTLMDYVKAHTDEESNTDYQAVLEDLYSSRPVQMEFYSADRIDASDEDKLRHVIFFDAGRQDWAEYNKAQEESVSSTIGAATVAIGNAYKTVEEITVKNKDTFLYLDNYIHEDICSYTVTGNSAVSETGVLFTDMFLWNVTFKLADITTIKEVKFEQDDITEKNVFYIDVLNPVYPDSVIAYGVDSKGEEVNLGVVDSIEYSSAFQELIFNKDETLEGYDGFSQVFSNDDAYYIVIQGDNGAETKVYIKTLYKDRSIQSVSLYSSQYAAQGEEHTDGVAYSILKNGKNVITIDPINTSVINGDKDGYILPDKMEVTYGNGEVGYFTDIVWSGDIPFSLNGSDYIPLDLVSYHLEAEQGYYLIEFSYGTTNKVIMTKYNDDDTVDTSVGKRTFTLTGRPDWNIYVKVLDRRVLGVLLEDGKVSAKDIVTETDQDTGKDISVIDVSGIDLGYINQYCPEYFEKLRILFTDKNADGTDTGGKTVEITLQQSDWAPYYADAYQKIITNSKSDKEVIALFNYCGYNIYLKFSAYDISLTNVSMVDGGTLYVVYNDSSVAEQVEKYYSVLYYNFGTDEEPNWKKIQWYPSKGTDDINYRTLGDYGTVYGRIGVDSATVNDNIKFKVEVVSPEMFASLDGALTDYVQYDYFSYASEKDGKKVSAISGEPNFFAEYFVTSADSSILFEIDKSKTKYDFSNGQIIFTVSYDFGSDVSQKIAFDEDGTRKYSFTLTKELKSYLSTDITDDNSVSFNKDNTDKKWTWVQTGKFEAAVDAIYWPLGEKLYASDMPTMKTDDGLTIYPLWNLNNVNVNRASEDGYEVEAYYMLPTKIWSKRKLTIYIQKYDISDTVISYVNECISGGKSSSKAKSFDREYDASFYNLNLNTDNLVFLRDDGSKKALDSTKFIVWYRQAQESEIIRGEEGVQVKFVAKNDDEDLWSTDEYPINAGYYFIRITIDDYNVCITDQDSDGQKMSQLLFTLIINPQTIDLTDENMLLFLHQKISTTNIVETYDGNDKALSLVSWRPAGDTDSWGSYDIVYSHADEELRLYIDSIFATVQAERQQKIPNITDEQVKAYIYENYMVASALPEVKADNWFGTGEKETLVTKYADKGSTVAAKAAAYIELFNRVSLSTQKEMTRRYTAQKKVTPKASDAQIKAAVYDDLPETLYLCEVAMHIEYTYGNQTSETAPSDVGTYKVTISILADENDGNYISYSKDTDENGHCYVSRVLTIEQDATVSYEVASPTISYNGMVQNPSVYPVCDEDGKVERGVTITYTYTLSDGVLVVVRTRDGAKIDASKTTSKSAYAGIKDVGEYPVRISVKGSDETSGVKNYKDSDVDITATIRIIPAEIFIEIEDITSDYLDEIRDLKEFIRIHNGETEYVCETCGSEVDVTITNGVYTLRCPDCDVAMDVDFSYYTSKCCCADCQSNRNKGGQELSTLEMTTKDGQTYYTVTCPKTAVSYGIYHNNSILRGTDTLSSFGELMVSTDVKDQYPIGTYLTYIAGLALTGGTVSYTYIDSYAYKDAYTGVTLTAEEQARVERFGEFKKLVLKSRDTEGSLLKNSTDYADIIALFNNYAFYVREKSSYFVQPDEGTLVSNDQELQEVLSELEAGDTVKIYLEPIKDNNGYVPYSPIVIGQNGDVNVTIIGYYDITTMDIATEISGITVKNGSLTMEIVNVVVASSSGYGVKVEKTAGSVRISSCLIHKDTSTSYTGTVGLATEVGYSGKVNISGNTKFSNLMTAIVHKGGALEIKECSFANNTIGIYVAVEEVEVSIRTSLFMNHSSCAVSSVSSDVIIQDNRFFFNSIAIRIPEILNDDTYKNTFIATELCEEMDDVGYIDIDTNGQDFVLTKEE